jgi:hypothetical protein
MSRVRSAARTTAALVLEVGDQLLAVDLAEHPTSTARSVRSSSQSIRIFGEGAALRVPAELSDPVGPLEVGQHEDVEQLGAGSRAERVEAFAESALELVGSHGRRLRRRTVHPRVVHRPFTNTGASRRVVHVPLAMV